MTWDKDKQTNNQRSEIKCVYVHYILPIFKCKKPSNLSNNFEKSTLSLFIFVYFSVFYCNLSHMLLDFSV